MARIPLAYPKIPDSRNSPSIKCVAFEKYDGTNLHWVWERELGWYAFGLRRNRYDLDEIGIAQFNQEHPGLEEAPLIFARDFAEPLATIFTENQLYNFPEITVFTEFLGSNSFAGKHKKDDPKKLILFDVQTESGMIVPSQFVLDFSALNIARVVYRGKLTGKFIEDVRQGKYNVNEGVVCKGGSNPYQLWMVKIKTNAYREKLKQAFADNWENYWE